MEISDDAKGGILVLTRYFLDFFRARGFKRVIDDFAKKANIDEKQPLDGLYMEYWGLWLERHKHIPYWAFFCQKKLEAFKKHFLQQPLSDNQSSLGESYTSTTRTHFSPQDSGHSKLRTSLDSGMITRLQVILVNMVVNIIFGYIFLSSDVHINDMFKKPEANEQPHDLIGFHPINQEVQVLTPNQLHPE
ncbi:hypothetical protein Lser_V15G04114 [Lactuca serriola]